jgi:subtilisin family serine protease
MPVRPQLGGAALTAALIAALMPGTAHAAPGGGAQPVGATSSAPAAARTSAQPKSGTRNTITLITGDKLAISTDGAQSVTVLPSPGRENARFTSRTVKGHLQVIPLDAVEKVQKGLLDPRLFDVTQLIADGFGDDKTSRIPLIVSNDGSPVRGLAATGVRDLRAIKAQAITQDKKNAAANWKNLTTAKGLKAGVRRILLDGIAHTSLDASVPQIGAPAAWAAGYTGDGVDVGLIDSGVDTTHPDLKDVVVESKNFLDTPPGPDAPPGPPFPPEDDNDYAGHGSHVASIIAGRGAASAGKYTGVAPKAKIYSAKVCNQVGACPESAILAGMQWIAEKKLRVANMSLGRPNWPGLDPLEEAVQNLTAQYGTLFVIASGNDTGPASSPSSAPDALSVGAVDKKGNIAPFSSGGGIEQQLQVKPEVTAPGVAITAAQSSFAADYDGEPYVTHSGTSMATPHVTGAVAILAQQHPDWTAAQLKAALVTSAKQNPATTPSKQGAGLIDVGQAVTQTVTASPLSLSFGEHRWPHEDDKPVPQTVTYRNSGAAPVTLALSATAVYDWTGKPAATELVSLSATSVTVPAGGEASVTVTGNPAVETPPGFFSGTVTAASAGATINTPWVLFKDEETHQFTLKNIDRYGKPTQRVVAQLYNLEDRGQFGLNIEADGTGTIRLPKGTYTLSVKQFTGSGDDFEMTELVKPLVNSNKDTEVVADGRVAKPLAVTVPEKGATQIMGNVHFTFAMADGNTWLGEDLTGPNFDRLYAGQIGPDSKHIRTTVAAFFAKKSAGGGHTDSPYLYNLVWHMPGRYITGFEKKVTPRELAVVRSSFASEAENTVGESSTSHREIGQRSRGWSQSVDFHLPFSRTDYYNADGRTEWSTETSYGDFLDGDQRYLAIRGSDWTRYQAGRFYDQGWNKAVYSPAFVPWNDSAATRTGDEIVFAPELISDASNRSSWSMGDEHTTVVRNGQVIQDDSSAGAYFSVPPAAADYRITIAADRAEPAVLAKNMTTTWTFRSGHVDGDKPLALPVSTIRFTPRVDENNTAQAAYGGIVVPISVEAQAGSQAGDCKSLTVQVSYNDGKTWTPAHLDTMGNRAVALLQNPDGHGYVSLKALATSKSGSTVEQTVLRAFKY